MASAIDHLGLRQLLKAAAEALEREEPRLNALDSAIGDGDHGITMRIGFQAVIRVTEALPPDSRPDRILVVAGKAFMNSTGGAIGVLFGRALIAAGEAVSDRNILAAVDWKLFFDAMERTVATIGKAKPGDKTMLDPLHAINDALQDAKDDTESADCLLVAANAAERAAEATARMNCRMGRASRLGDRVLGHPDPGAVSFSIITRAFADRARDLSSAHLAQSR
jgi:phosphoenolpyruvate---glycerone phosphotransferase subunit DhaL